MRSSRSRWLSGIGAAVLIGGLVLASGGSGVTPASAHKPPPPPNPFAQILTKLDEVLAAIAGIGGGGSVDLCHGGTTVGRFVPIGTTEVCDRTTGLTWQKTPDATLRDQPTALTYCLGLGNQYRLPEVKELISLVDYSQFNPALPVGHPFTNVQSAGYWSASPNAAGPVNAWFVHFAFGDMFNAGKTIFLFAWCVRGA